MHKRDERKQLDPFLTPRLSIRQQNGNKAGIAVDFDKSPRGLPSSRRPAPGHVSFMLIKPFPCSLYDAPLTTG